MDHWLTRDGGYRGWIVWDTGGNAEIEVPAEWGVRQVRSLDKAPHPIRLATVQKVGPLPLLLERPAKGASH